MKSRQGFAVWITGIPASGKSSIARELAQKLRNLGAVVAVLESDELRKILTPHATYSSEERDRFYQTLAQLGELLTRNGINVVFDATANKRGYRDGARFLIPRFLETYVQCPVDVCMRRDPKGIYSRAKAGDTATVPGIQAPYEPPLNPELTLDGQGSPERSADIILDELKRLLYV